MNKEETQKQLDMLINRWKGKVPKPLDKEWWKFKCDRCLAIRLRNQIEHPEIVEKIEAEELDCAMAEKILMN